MGVDFITVLAFFIVGVFSIFCLFPLIGKSMRFFVNTNTEKNEYRANLMNGLVMLVFLCGLTFLIYCVGIVLSVLLAVL